jgi:hypothetical protein
VAPGIEISRNATSGCNAAICSMASCPLSTIAAMRSSGHAATSYAGIIAFTALGKDDFIASGPVRHFDGYCQKGGTRAPLLVLINGMLV